MKIGCVIITYNIEEKILDTFNSIYNQVEQIIFIDNNSNLITKDILSKLKNEHKKCEVIFNEKNEGIAKALNIGINKLLENGVDFILTLDHDSIASSNMISEMINVYDDVKDRYRIGILSPAIYDINKKDYLTDVNLDEYQVIKEPIQSGSLINKEIFNNGMFYNEKLFIYYVDTDLCYRLNLKGYTNIQCNRATLYHEEGQKSCHNLLGKKLYYNNYSDFAIYYRARNGVYMKKKYKGYFSSKYVIYKDIIKILIFDKKPYKRLLAHFRGVFDGIKLTKGEELQ